MFLQTQPVEDLKKIHIAATMVERIRNTRFYKKWLEIKSQRAADGHPDKVEGLAVPCPPLDPPALT